MSSCDAEFHGLSMQLAPVRADLESSQKRSPNVCAPQARPPLEHSASHGLSAQPSQEYSSRLPTALNSSLRVAAPLPHAGAHQTESCPVQTSDPPRAIPHNGLINDRRHCRPAPAGQCPPSSCTLPVVTSLLHSGAALNGGFGSRPSLAACATGGTCHPRSRLLPP